MKPTLLSISLILNFVLVGCLIHLRTIQQNTGNNQMLKELNLADFGSATPQNENLQSGLVTKSVPDKPANFAAINHQTLSTQVAASAMETETTSSYSVALQNEDAADLTTVKNPPPSKQATTPAAVTSPSYPLVLQNVNLDALGLTTAQKAVVQQLQQQFVNDIGGTDQNPNDPAYLARWQQAQPQSDLMLKAMMGITAWENFQLAAADSGSTAQNPYTSSDASP